MRDVVMITPPIAVFLTGITVVEAPAKIMYICTYTCMG